MQLRMDGATDWAFRERKEQTAIIARVLVDACLANRQVQDLLTAGE